MLETESGDISVHTTGASSDMSLFAHDTGSTYEPGIHPINESSCRWAAHHPWVTQGYQGTGEFIRPENVPSYPGR